MKANITKLRVAISQVRHGALSRRGFAWRRLAREAPDRQVIADAVDGEKFRVSPRDIIGGLLYVRGVFEPRETAFVKRCLRPGDVFVDVGANMGYYTVIGAECVGNAGAVHSFEPNARMFEELTFNVSLNGIQSSCMLNNCGVSNEAGVGRLSRYQFGHEVYGSLGTHQRGDHGVDGYDEVPLVSLDEYVHDHGIRSIRLIKLDIEGAELLAIKGCARLLAWETPPAFLIEFMDENTLGFNYHAVEIWEFLESRAFKFFEIDRRGRLSSADKPESFPYTRDLVAIHRDQTGSWGV